MVGLAVLALTLRRLPQTASIAHLWREVFVFGLTSYLRDIALTLALARRQHGWATWVSIVPAVASLALFLLLPSSFRNASGAFLAQSIGFTLGSIGLVQFVRAYPESDPGNRLPVSEWFPPAAQGYGSTLLMLAMLRADLLVVGYRFSDAEAGIYSVAQSMAELFLKFPSWTAMVLTPFVAASNGDQSPRTLRLAWAAVLLSSALAVLAVVSRGPAARALGILAGDRYVAAYPLMLWLLPRVIIQSGMAFLAGHLAGQGYTIWHPAQAAAGLTATGVLCMLLVPRLGLSGAALGVSLGILPAAVVLLFGFCRRNNIHFLTVLRAASLGRAPQR
jgi:O-antigen/teichoic acid export membrane protein